MCSAGGEGIAMIRRAIVIQEVVIPRWEARRAPSFPQVANPTVCNEGALLTDEGLQAHRDAYRNAIRAFHAEGKMARTWPLRYLIRHTAFHTLDHAWEMEDKDLTVGVR
jgi:hypothetical protein